MNSSRDSFLCENRANLRIPTALIVISRWGFYGNRSSVIIAIEDSVPIVSPVPRSRFDFYHASHVDLRSSNLCGRSLKLCANDATRN